LPVRYLGVPLLAKKLGVGDCQVHIDKVEERINNWRNKNLSYARIIQLIASVLSLMQIYWASVYLLPITVINDLEKLFKKFLWNAGDSAKGKARVALKMVCRPKEQVWYDKWCTDGPLSIVISREDMYDARLDDDAKCDSTKKIIGKKVTEDSSEGEAENEEMTLLGPSNALLKEVRLVMVEGVCFKASDAVSIYSLRSSSRWAAKLILGELFTTMKCS
ncbi:hypothetical protein Tco_0461541, partial [Tanacetum coccineum]